MRVNESRFPSGDSISREAHSVFSSIRTSNLFIYLSLSTLILPQLLMMKHSSVFINDSAEAGRLIQEMPSKGPIYSAFRYDTNVPDMLGTSLRRKTHDLDIRAEY